MHKILFTALLVLVVAGCTAAGPDKSSDESFAKLYEGPALDASEIARVVLTTPSSDYAWPYLHLVALDEKSLSPPGLIERAEVLPGGHVFDITYVTCALISPRHFPLPIGECTERAKSRVTFETVAGKRYEIRAIMEGFFDYDYIVTVLDMETDEVVVPKSMMASD